MPAKVSPITAHDLPQVAEFLHNEFPHEPRESTQTWLDSLAPPWKGSQPNYGYLVRDGDRIVGVYLAHYSEQEIDGRSEPFCNLGVWHVVPESRAQSLPLARALLGQRGYHFTDLTPAPNVAALNARLGFEELDTSAVLVPCLPWPSAPGAATIGSDPADLRRLLSGSARRAYEDHSDAPGLRHVAIRAGGECCYVALRPDRHGRLPVLSVLQVSDRTLFENHSHAFARHLLLRHRCLAYVAELRLIGFRPRIAKEIAEPPTRMFRSDRLSPDQIGYLYSELVFVGS